MLHHLKNAAYKIMNYKEAVLVAPTILAWDRIMPGNVADNTMWLYALTGGRINPVTLAGSLYYIANLYIRNPRYLI